MDGHDHDLDHDLKSAQQSHGSSGFMRDTPPRADVDEILRRKRKAREYKVRASVHARVIYLEMRREHAQDARSGGGEGKVSFVCQIGLQDPAHRDMNDYDYDHDPTYSR